MGIPKKGSKKIQVGENSYRYIVKPCMSKENVKELQITVQEECDERGRVMQFRWPYLVEITPRVVAGFIQQALDKGWNPKEKAPAFKFKPNIDN